MNSLYINDVCRFSRDHVVECSERTVLSCLEPVCLCWRRFGRYFSHHLAKSDGWPADLCTSVGPAWKHGLLVIGGLFLHSDWMMCLLPLSFSAGNQMCGSLYDIPLM